MSANRINRGRFAPSPSGELHLGSARTALVAWASIRQTGGSFVLRIEDLDRARTRPGSEAQMLADLRWLGLDWDEGPDVGGGYGPYRQSERLDHYQRAIGSLREKNEVFACSCSRADVARAAAAPHVGEEGPRYPGTCRALHLAPENHATRFHVPAGDISFVDGIHGAIVQAPADQVGDFVIQRADGVFAYQLAVVVDDIAMQMSEIVRGDDLLASTGRQLQLYRSLGGTAPRFFHIPLLLGPTGERLAKRDGAISIAALRSGGVAAVRIVGYLAWTLGLNPSNRDLRADDFVHELRMDRINRNDVKVNPGELDAR